MSKRTRALEERFRSKPLKPWERPAPNIIQDEIANWTEIAKAHYEKTRNCTLQDVAKFIADKREMSRTGYWVTSYFGSEHKQPNWEKQVEEIYEEARPKTILWTWEEMEANMVTLWKAKYTKLGRVLS